MRTFVTGPTGSGKTTLATKLATEAGVPLISHDDAYGYKDVSGEHCKRFLKELPEECVVDAIPKDPGYSTFNKWAEENEVTVFCNVLPEKEWLGRPTAGGHSLEHWKWAKFWVTIFPLMQQLPVYVGPDGDRLSHRDAMETIGMPGLIRERIERQPGGVDARYQDIPEIGYSGYERTRETWDRISGLVDWSRCKSVLDCGTHHGYILFRISDAGCAGRLVGLDRNDYYLTTARAVNALRGDDVEFREWQAGWPCFPVDVTLCLNALHHFPDPRKFVDSVMSPMAIFEIKTEQDLVLGGHWKTVKSYESPRPGRRIYRCTR